MLGSFLKYKMMKCLSMLKERVSNIDVYKLLFQVSYFVERSFITLILLYPFIISLLLRFWPFETIILTLHTEIFNGSYTSAAFHFFFLSILIVFTAVLLKRVKIYFLNRSSPKYAKKVFDIHRSLNSFDSFIPYVFILLFYVVVEWFLPAYEIVDNRVSVSLLPLILAMTALVPICMDYDEINRISLENIRIAALNEILDFLETREDWKKEFYERKIKTEDNIYVLATTLEILFEREITAYQPVLDVEELFRSIIMLYEISEKKDKNKVLEYFKQLAEILRKQEIRVEDVKMTLKILLNMQKFVNSKKATILTKTRLDLASDLPNKTYEKQDQGGIGEYLKNIIISAVTSAITAILVTTFLTVTTKVTDIILEILSKTPIEILILSAASIFYLLIFVNIIVYRIIILSYKILLTR